MIFPFDMFVNFNFFSISQHIGLAYQQYSFFLKKLKSVKLLQDTRFSFEENL